MSKTALKTEPKIRRDLRPVRVKILEHLAASGGEEQRRWVRRYFQNMKGFKQAYRDLLDTRVISEQGRGVKCNPIMTVLESPYDAD